MPSPAEDRRNFRESRKFRRKWCFTSGFRKFICTLPEFTGSWKSEVSFDFELLTLAKKNGRYLELILQGLTYPIWFFSVSLMKVYQICYLTVKDSFKSMNAVRNNSPIINTGVIDESPSFFLLCIFQKIIIIFERLSLINGTKLRHADFTIT